MTESQSRIWAAFSLSAIYMARDPRSLATQYTLNLRYARREIERVRGVVRKAWWGR